MSPASRPSGRGRSAGALLLLSGLALIGLTRLRDRLPPSPPVTDPRRWPRWAADLDPLDAAAGAVRTFLIAVAAYLLVVAVAALVARRRPDGPFARGVRVVTPRLLTFTLVGSLAGSPSALAVPRTAEDIWMEHLEVVDDLADHDLEHPGTRLPTGVAPNGPATDPDPVPETLDPPAALPKAPPVAHQTFRGSTLSLDSAEHRTEREIAAGAHVVLDGEHLWGIAADTVSAATGSTDPHDVAAYWIELIEANRHRLPDPRNPDLIHPGMRVDLPMLAPAGPRARLSEDGPPPSDDGG